MTGHLGLFVHPYKEMSVSYFHVDMRIHICVFKQYVHRFYSIGVLIICGGGKST